MAATPLLLAHAYLQGKTKSIIESLDIAIVKFLNFADGQKPIEVDGDDIGRMMIFRSLTSRPL